MAFKKERLQEIIRHEVSQILERDFRRPGVLVTVLGADVSPDRQHAVIFFSVYPADKGEEIDQMIGRVIGIIQRDLNHTLQMRPVPKLRFVRDTSAAEAASIESLIKQESSASVTGHARRSRRTFRKSA
ncbi:MAG: 30S ribosome-binding factor RbfA [bacterium]|nr:30S ribosome-binding factor RbfA [bacterium]